MWESREARGPCSIAALWDCARSLADRSQRSASPSDIQNRERFLVSEFIEDIAPQAEMEAKARGITLSVMPVESGVTIEGDRQSPHGSGGKPAAERLQVHAAWDHRDAARRGGRPASAYRGSGRMRGPRGWKGRRTVPPVRAARCRPNRPGPRPRVQPMGRRREQWPDLRAQSRQSGCVFTLDLPEWRVRLSSPSIIRRSHGTCTRRFETLHARGVRRKNAFQERGGERTSLGVRQEPATLAGAGINRTRAQSPGGDVHD